MEERDSLESYQCEAVTSKLFRFIKTWNNLFYYKVIKDGFTHLLLRTLIPFFAILHENYSFAFPKDNQQLSISPNSLAAFVTIVARYKSWKECRYPNLGWLHTTLIFSTIRKIFKVDYCCSKFPQYQQCQLLFNRSFFVWPKRITALNLIHYRLFVHFYRGQTLTLFSNF